MYIPTRVYAKHNHTIDSWPVADITPTEVYRKIDTEDTVVYLSLRDDTKTTKNNFDINFGEMLTDTDIGTSETWGQIAQRLTQALVLGYSTRLPGYVSGTDRPKCGLIMWNAMNTFKTFSIGYADHLSKRANIPAIKWALPDVRIGLLEGTTNNPSLNNSIPIVNGLACRPVYDAKRNYLYGLGGARYSWNDFMPEVSLLDFSKLGSIKIERLVADNIDHLDSYRNATVILVQKTESNENAPLVFHRPWELYTTYSLSEYTPLVVLGGSIIWPDEIIIDDEHHYHLKLNTKVFNRTRVWAQYCMNDAATDAEVMYKAPPVLDYFQEQFNLPEDTPSGECFAVYVHNVNLVVNRRNLISWKHGISLDLFATVGVLIKDYTHTIHPYHAASLVDRQVLTVQRFENLYLDTQGQRNTEYMISEHDCAHADLMSLGASSYRMLYLLS